MSCFPFRNEKRLVQKNQTPDWSVVAILIFAAQTQIILLVNLKREKTLTVPRKTK